jgi:hypothetical protein
MIALVLKPFFFCALMGAIVIPIELAVRRMWPRGRVKQILFTRNFDKRHPRIWTALVLSSYVGLGLLLWGWFSVRPHLMA